jgi:rubrerythrin
VDELWKLIQDEADAVAKYYAFLESDYAKQEKTVPVAQVIDKIIRDEIDHLNALKYLFDKMSRLKASTDMSDFAAQAIEKYREARMLIKP